VGLIKVRGAQARSAEEGAETVPYVAELTAIVHNQGDALADETITRFWVRGADIDRSCGSSIPRSCRRARRSRSPRSGTSAAGAGEHVTCISA
jgi:hypothetical protein